jgi:exonuclease SbcC
VTNQLRSLHVRDLQSLEKLDVKLGRLTVIVGPSDVGKSAIIRTLRLLIRNGPSTGLVRTGAKTLKVAASQTDGPSVKLTRGARTSEYEVISTASGAKELHAKCGTSVPGDIERTWRVHSELTFCGQHDAPFMVSEPGSAGARILGELTNASLLTEAVREANRRRSDAAQRARSLEREAEECRAALANAPELARRRRAIEEATTAVGQAEAARALWGDLGALVERRDACLSRSRTTDRGPSDDALAALEEAERLADRATRLRASLARLAELTDHADRLEERVTTWQESAEALERERTELLHRTGTCPTCGAQIR